MPLEGDWQLPGLARSVTLPILGWPNTRMQPTASRPRSLRFSKFHLRSRRLMPTLGGSLLRMTGLREMTE
jgi:hypothetical protein